MNISLKNFKPFFDCVKLWLINYSHELTGVWPHCLKTVMLIKINKKISPSSEQPEQCILAYKSELPTTSCIAIFHKYCCYINHGSIINKFESIKSLGVCYWYVEIPQCGYMEYGLLYIMFYVLKLIAPLASCSNPLLVCDNQPRSPAFVRLPYWT